MQVCSVINSESAGLLITTPDDLVRRIPAFTTTLHVDHGGGVYEQDEAVELWALRDDGPLPDDATDASVYDMDEDGHPGATGIASGIVSGEVYFVQRKTVAYSGVTTADGALGIATVVKQSRTLDATNEQLKGQAERKPALDPKDSWFAEVPLADGADCDDVVDARESEALPRVRPF